MVFICCCLSFVWNLKVFHIPKNAKNIFLLYNIDYFLNNRIWCGGL
jgi:hypothetical protein